VATYFLDSSALVKCYVSEPGSVWVRELLYRPRDTRYVSVLAEVEVAAAIMRRCRAGSLPIAAWGTLHAAFRPDLECQLTLMGVTAATLSDATRMIGDHGLRAYDAVQLATAWRVYDECVAASEPFRLVSADAELNAAARAEGMRVEDPNAYP
jgi:hypothetical protein